MGLSYPPLLENSTRLVTGTAGVLARIRTVKIGFFKNEQLAELSMAHRLLFQGLWLLADREGRLEDRPKRIKGELFPYDDVDVSAMLTDLSVGDDSLIIRYTANGKGYLAVRKFTDHQRPHYSEPPSSYPAPNQALTQTAENSAATAEIVVTATLGREGKGKEGNGGGKGTEEAARLPPEAIVALEIQNAAPAFGFNPHSKASNLINGSELRRHGQHAWCSWPARDGLCVPAALHLDLAGRLGTDTAKADLLRWYPAVVARYAGLPVGDSVFDFWRNEFAAWVGTVTVRPSHRAATSAESNLRGLAEDIALLDIPRPRIEH
jgi:hypothetical protein